MVIFHTWYTGKSLQHKFEYRCKNKHENLLADHWKPEYKKTAKYVQVVYMTALHLAFPPTILRLSPISCCLSHALAATTPVSWACVSLVSPSASSLYYHTLYSFSMSYFIHNIYKVIHLPIYGSRALVDLGLFFSFLIYTESVEILGRGISPS
jgi:hypothetical protein